MAACAYCSTELLSDWKFCINCGRKVIPAAFRPDPYTQQEAASGGRYLAVLIVTIGLVTAIAGVVVVFYFARG